MTVVTVSSGAVADVDTVGLDVLDGEALDSTTLSGAVPADTRHARALEALRSAEVRTGVRKQATTPSRESRRFHDPRDSHESRRPSDPRPHQSGESSHDGSREQSRAQVLALPGSLASTPASTPTNSPAPSSGSRTGGPGENTRVLPVHPRLAGLLPDGGLRTGTTVVVRGSTSLLLTLLAEASRDGAWTVLVGYPAAGMAAAADAGCDLTRTLVVPLPTGSGVDAPAVLAALIDGMDVVVVGPEVALLDQDRRRLTARARERGTVLVAALPTPALSAGSSPLQRLSAGRKASTQHGWGGAQVVLEATEGAWAGIDHGAGWLRRRTLRVRRTGRGSAARPLYVAVELPVYRAGSGAEAAGEERAREAAPLDGDVQRQGSGSRSRLGLVG
ncbi:hypothetical protein GCM10027063_25120 [Promicromonospora xylanilytica]